MTESLSRRHSPNRGFTLVEVLVSLLIVSLGLAALAPILALVVYRRVQSERVEVASQLAQGEIDRIRALVDRGPREFDASSSTITLNTLPLAGGDFSRTAADAVEFVGGNAEPPTNVPANFTTITAYNPEIQNDTLVTLVQIKKNETAAENPTDPAFQSDPARQYIIQSYRNVGDVCRDERGREYVSTAAAVTDPSEQVFDPDFVSDGIVDPCSFRMAVRVYHRFSFTPDGTGRQYPLDDPDFLSRPASAVVSGNSNDAWVEMLARPMTVLEAEVGESGSLENICRSLRDEHEYLSEDAETLCDPDRV